ncbi:hypothetical protein GGD50_006406 [Rhizobium paranaense]|uniref:Uncharacterized protein n=1 Tax=Rhizobium paranaense TaxID=1650438 RepID=A0A7W8XY65_9HYPH|nr:hypothetical protein [Rhizobium paranaense]
MRAHLSAGGMRIGCGEKTGEKLTNGHAARQHQSFVAIMQMQPIVIMEEFVEQRRRLMSGTGNVKMCYALLDEFSFKPVYFTRCEKYSMKLLEMIWGKSPFHFNDFPNLS